MSSYPLLGALLSGIMPPCTVQEWATPGRVVLIATFHASNVSWAEESDPFAWLDRTLPVVACSDHCPVFLGIAIDEGIGPK